MTAAAALLAAWALATAHPQAPTCLAPQDRGLPAEPAPTSLGMELVGIGFDRKLRPTAVIRAGQGKDALTTVAVAGDTIHGRASLVQVGTVSALVKQDGRFYVLKLKNRAPRRSWTAFLKRLPTCAP